MSEQNPAQELTSTNTNNKQEQDEPPKEENVKGVQQSKSPIVDKQALRKNLTAPPAKLTSNANGTGKDQKTTNNMNVNSNTVQTDTSQQQLQKPSSNANNLGYKNYACDKCKLCDEFEQKTGNDGDKTSCNNCGCALIFHLRDGDESPVEDEDEDPQEWHDEDEVDEEEEEGDED